MRRRRRTGVLLAVLAALVVPGAGGCGTARPAAPAQTAATPLRVASWSAEDPSLPAGAVRRNCRPTRLPGVEVSLAVPRAYAPVDGDRSRGCTWATRDDTVDQITVAITRRSLRDEAARQRDPVRNGRDAGVAQGGSSLVRYARAADVLGHRPGERLSYRSDYEGVPLRVRALRVAPVTLTVAVDSGSGARYRDVDALVARLARSLAARG